MVTEMLKEKCETAGVRLTEAESTLLALGIHADTGDTLVCSTVRYTTARYTAGHGTT